MNRISLATSKTIVTPYGVRYISLNIINKIFFYIGDSEPIDAAWRVNDGIDDKDKLKWWKKRFNRQALITIRPAAGGTTNILFYIM